MKRMKKNLLTLGLSLTLLAGTVTAGTPREKKETNSNLEYKDYLKTYMLEKEIEELMSDEDQVQIMNISQEMVMQGSIANTEVQKLIRVADLVTVIDGVKYYRLSYK